MEQSRHQFLAGAVLAVYDHPSLRGGREVDLLPERLHRHRGADHDRLLPDQVLQAPVFRFQALLLERVTQHQQDLVPGQRFLDEVVGSQLGGLDRRLDGAVAGDHDDVLAGAPGSNPLEGVDPVHAGQPDVEEDGVVGGPVHEAQPFLGAGRRFHQVALVSQDSGQRTKDAPVVVYDQQPDSGMASAPERIVHLSPAGPVDHADGNSMMNRVPRGSFRSARMKPSCSETICLTMASPRPVPRFLVEK